MAIASNMNVAVMKLRMVRKMSRKLLRMMPELSNALGMVSAPLPTIKLNM
jgi:hypothetical protein